MFFTNVLLIGSCGLNVSVAHRLLSLDPWDATGEGGVPVRDWFTGADLEDL